MNTREKMEKIKVIQKAFNKIETQIYTLIELETDQDNIDKYYDTIHRIHCNQMYADDISKKIKRLRKKSAIKKVIYLDRITSLEIEVNRAYFMVSSISGNIYEPLLTSEKQPVHIAGAVCKDDDEDDEE